MVEYNCPIKKKKTQRKRNSVSDKSMVEHIYPTEKKPQNLQPAIFPASLDRSNANMKVGTAETRSRYLVRSRYFVSLRVEKYFLNLVQLKHVWNVITHFLIDWAPK